MINVWGDDVARSPEPPAAEELDTLLRLAHGNRSERKAWYAARENWRPSLEPELLSRLLCKPIDPDLRSELAYCGLCVAPHTLIDAIEALKDQPADQLMLIVDVWAARGHVTSKKRTARFKKIAFAISPELREIADALAYKNRPAKGVRSQALSHLQTNAGYLSIDALEAVVPVILASGGDATESIRRWLLETEDSASALKATETAQASGYQELLQVALEHKRAEARCAALIGLAPTLSDPLPDHILAMAKDPGSRVRRALVSILSDRLHPEHQKVLLRLTADTWSGADVFDNEREYYLIAQEAVKALAEYVSLDDDVGLHLLDLSDRTPDRKLSQFALTVAAHSCSPEIRARIWEMVHIPAARWIRLDALATADLVEPAIASRVTTQLLLSLPPILAVPATVLLANHVPVADVIRTLERVASSNKHRALVLIGAETLNSKNIEPPLVCRRAFVSNVRLLFHLGSRLHRTSPLLHAA
ncbi:hypothetical protein EOK75_05860 [Pseudorhodobacter turbinis]|uniref:HEAT repeat domain-containing protein n=1 Tax=Pseudorhodobacter turbinis TaxID=2500533 RepID=A0A4P8EF73_9RHOB|nr:hypothetical protein [Pseudorhodobacter turbinis]QCO55342.1 hypothetical protein EOK75_05860 [Pseudorhodobacter turbinis]